MDLKDLRFTKKHEWAKVDGDVATVGICNYAQSQFGDIVYVELPEEGDTTTQFEECATIESVKAVEPLYAPVSGEIVEMNDELENTPETINKDCYGQGWIIKIKMSNTSEVDNLMDYEEYKKYEESMED